MGLVQDACGNYTGMCANMCVPYGTDEWGVARILGGLQGRLPGTVMHFDKVLDWVKVACLCLCLCLCLCHRVCCSWESASARSLFLMRA
jgi:hypothetical protein